MPKWNLKIAILLIKLSLIMFITAAESCNMTFHATGPLNRRSGTITSVNFPKPYPAGVSCEYHFINAKETRLRLTFTDFDLREAVPDTDGQCAFDFVDIFLVDGTNTPMKMMERTCGNAAPKELSTSAQHVIIYFKSRSTVNDQYTGYRADFSFSNDTSLLPLSSVDSTEDAICGVTRLRGTGGILTAPTLHANRDLQAKQRQTLLSTGMINCTWTLRITEGDQILINFLSLNLGPSEVVCRDSYLLMYNSVSDFEKVGSLEKICGRLSLYPGKSKEYVSTGPWLTIRYIYRLPNMAPPTAKSETSPTASSSSDFDSTLAAPTMASALSYEPNFRLVWTAIWNLKQGEECPGFECAGRQTCLDAGKIVCHKTPRYCVHPTLRCDGIPHCGPHDTSDEENCQLPLILSGVAAGVGILLTLVAAIALIVWRIRMPKQRRTKAKPFGKPPSRTAKTGAPPNLGRMMEHMADKKQATAEYSAVITNQHLVNTRSILASLNAQENAKNAAAAAAADPSSPNPSPLRREGSRPTAIKPSIIVNRHAGLVSVRFAPVTPPGMTPEVEEQKQPPPAAAPQPIELPPSAPTPPQTSPKPPEQPPVKQPEPEPDPLISIPDSAAVCLPLLASPPGNMGSGSAVNSSAPTSPRQREIATSISHYENPLDSLADERLPLKMPLSEEESGSVSFPPPPTTEEIIFFSATSPVAITPPSYMTAAVTTTTAMRRSSSGSHPGSGEDRTARLKQQLQQTLPPQTKQKVPSSSSSQVKDLSSSSKRHHHHQQQHHANGNAEPGSGHLGRKTNKDAGIEAKAIAKLLRENPPVNSPRQQRQRVSSRSPSRSPHRQHHREHRDHHLEQQQQQQQSGSQLPPTAVVTSTASSDFQWELRMPGRGGGYVHGTDHRFAATTLPHYYANIREVVPPESPLHHGAHSPDSLASPKMTAAKAARSATAAYRSPPSDDPKNNTSSTTTATAPGSSRPRRHHHSKTAATTSSAAVASSEETAPAIVVDDPNKSMQTTV